MGVLRLGAKMEKNLKLLQMRMGALLPQENHSERFVEGLSKTYIQNFEFECAHMKPGYLLQRYYHVL
jgi:hypothetical protein